MSIYTEKERIGSPSIVIAAKYINSDELKDLIVKKQFFGEKLI